MVTKVHAFNTGAIPKKDYRNFKDKEVKEFLPKAASALFSLGGKILKIFYQGKLGTCVSHAYTWLKIFLDFLDTGEIKDYSPRFHYALCKSLDGIPDVEGTHPIIGAKVLHKFGVCTQENFVNNVNLPLKEYQDWKKIPEIAYEEAEDAMIESYVELTDKSFVNLKKQLAIYRAIPVCIKHGGEFYTDTKGNVTWDAEILFPLKKIDPIVSGHEVVLISKDVAVEMGIKDYNDDYIYFVNSFGDGTQPGTKGVCWGKKGIGWFGADYVERIKEAHLIVDLPLWKIKELKKKRETILYQIIAFLQKKVDGLLKK